MQRNRWQSLVNKLCFGTLQAADLNMLGMHPETSCCASPHWWGQIILVPWQFSKPWAPASLTVRTSWEFSNWALTLGPGKAFQIPRRRWEGDSLLCSPSNHLKDPVCILKIFLSFEIVGWVPKTCLISCLNSPIFSLHQVLNQLGCVLITCFPPTTTQKSKNYIQIKIKPSELELLTIALTWLRILCECH